MIKRVACVIFTIVIMLFSLTLTVNADQGADACAFRDLELEEYLAIIDTMAETGEHPHYFVENARRYMAFQVRYRDMPFETVIALVNVNNDLGSYHHVEIITEPDEIYVLLNKNFALPRNWMPDGLTSVGSGFQMRPEAAGKFNEMRAAMRDDGLSLVVVSTYRSIARQRNIFNNAAASRGVQRAERSIARPGHSEHHTGLAIDVMHRSAVSPMSRMRFENTAQFAWLVENAHEFGFILRYPQGYSQISGYIFEPWHWRYVGIPIATAMHNRGIVSYEDFYGRYLLQDMRERVNEFIVMQQRLAEEAEAAAVAAAAAEAAAIAAREAEEKAAAEAAAAELLRVEIMIRETLQTSAAETFENAEASAAMLGVSVFDVSYINRHFMIMTLMLVLSAAAAVLYVVSPKRKASFALRRQGDGSFVLCRIKRVKPSSAIARLQYRQVKFAFRL
jgi:D-alanyl-D-alanine carboxypeptidase